MRIFHNILPALLGCMLPAFALAQPAQLTFTPFVTGLNEPLFVTHAQDERVFIVEKSGYIRIADQQGNLQATPYLDIDARVKSSGNEQGLLGLAFHPDYQSNGYFYVNYTNSSNATVISRFSVSAGNPNLADATSELIMLTISQPFTNHNGGCIQFGSDGYLYIGMGDGGSGGDPNNNGQSTTSRLGKMLRIDVDGGTPYGIPPTNPYLGTSSVPDEVWAFGLRNPWRFSFDRQNGDLWIGDVGQDAWEEVDYVAYGSDPAPNFGWRCYEGTAPYNTSGCQPQGNYDAPIYVYANNGATGCSMTGGYIYRGGRYASMNGTYFHTDYCTGYIWQTRSNGPGWTTTQGSVFQSYDLVSFGEDAFGEMYILGIASGNVWRMQDTTSMPNAMIWARDTITTCDSAYIFRAAGTPTMSYQWQLNGSDIAGADTLVYEATQPGNYTVIVSNNGFSDTSGVVYLNFTTAAAASISGLDANYCDNAAQVTLSGSPAGGVFSGPGITGNTFSPSVANLGTNIITYTFDGGNGCISIAYDTTEVTTCVGIRPADLLPGFTCYPNPAQDMLRFAFDFPGQTEIEWNWIDLNGRMILNGSTHSFSGEFEETINLTNIAAGLYNLNLKVEGNRFSKRVSVVK